MSMIYYHKEKTLEEELRNILDNYKNCKTFKVSALIRFGIGFNFIIKEYLKSKKCEENLYFYVEVELFKNEIETPDEFLQTQSEAIYKKYFTLDSMYMINLDIEIVREIEQKIREKIVDRDVFDEAQKSIFRLMETACVRDFQKKEKGELLQFLKSNLIFFS